MKVIRHDETVEFMIPVDNHSCAVSKAEQGGLFTLWFRTNKAECADSHRGIIQPHLVCNPD